MLNIIRTENGALVGGLEWFPLDSMDSAASEVNEVIKRRKEAVDDSRDSDTFLPLGNKYAACNTSQGACAAGIALLESVREIPKKAASIAARCALFAQEQKTPDAIFGWRNEDEFNLIGIRNGLPIYDAVLSQNAFKSEVSSLLSMFEMGCTTFGDESLFLPPVIPVPLSALANNDGRGQIKTSGVPQWVRVVILISILSAIGGYFVWDAEAQARKKEAEVAEMEARMRQKDPTPAEIFVKTQSDGLLSTSGCQSIDVPAGKMLELHYLIRGYRVSSVTADCKTGSITASYLSSAPADLSVRQRDPRMKLTENLTNASIADSFLPQPVQMSASKMLPWQDWLVMAGTHKQEIARVGVQMSFGAVSPAFGLPPDGVDNIPVIVKGKLSIDGPAQYMLDAARLIDNTVWETLSISSNNGYITFNAIGDYYAIKD